MPKPNLAVLEWRHEIEVLKIDLAKSGLQALRGALLRPRDTAADEERQEARPGVLESAAGGE